MRHQKKKEVDKLANALRPTYNNIPPSHGMRPAASAARQNPLRNLTRNFCNFRFRVKKKFNFERKCIENHEFRCDFHDSDTKFEI